MRLRSNAPLTSEGMTHRIEIATYSDGRSVGYDPRTGTGFDVAGMAVTVNDVIAYDRIGSLTWDTETWREWTYARVGLAVAEDEPAPLPVLVSAGPSTSDAVIQPPRTALFRTGGAVVLAIIFVAAFVFGAIASSAPPNNNLNTTDSVSAVGAAEPNDAAQRGATSDVPAYVVVASGVQPQIGLVGNVAISPPDADVSSEQHERICIEIAKRERFAVMRLFRTADAYVAMRDATFRAENPGAIRHGFLGILTGDGYRTAEELDWETAIPVR